MSLADKKEEAEAVLDSAEMMLETYGSTGKTARELETKVKQLRNELQDPDSESSLNKKINEIRDLMDDMKETDSMGGGMMDEGDMMGGGPGGGMGGPDDDGMPPM
ncbi:hypothetical protein [Candidatus Nanohalococcus occultus]|uniref:Uncharacterized protein n=1 Tax=Candidatus Nanohalococcus occultus TaxID=2978047 RepID=A0ABY8CDR6_9ARCH|nr:hypothetical protein SVXNc_0329 [Candidatus Nanohaloarchaeota archaeon SVXNc]